MINKIIIQGFIALFFLPACISAQVKKDFTPCGYAGRVEKITELKQVKQKKKKAFNDEDEDEDEKGMTELQLKKAVENELKKTNPFPVNNKVIMAGDHQRRTDGTASVQDAGICLQFPGSQPNLAGFSYPADVTLAAGFEHLVQMTNNTVTMYTKDGNLVYNNSLSGFLSPLGSNSYFDPKVLYDHFSNRWIAVTPYNSRSSTSGIAIAISSTYDPTGAWAFYWIKADPNSNEWFDYPSVGFTTDKIVFSGNMFFNSGGNTESRTYVMDKAAYYNGTPPSSITTFAIPVSDAQRNVYPSINFDNNATSYCIEQSVGSGRNSLYTVTGSGSAPSWSYVGEIDFSSMGFINGTVDAPQKDTSALLDMGDSRVLASVLRNGYLYFTNSIANNAPQQTGVDVGFINLSNLSDGYKLRWLTSPEYFGYPNITVNKNGEIIGSVGRFSATSYATSGFIYWQPATQVNYINTVKNGLGHVALRDNLGRNRWGDYSGTGLDPSDELSVWVSSDYAIANNGGPGAYNTSIAKICPPCAAQLNINTAITAGQLKKFAAADITANSSIASGSLVKIQASNSVTLSDGFNATAGSNAKIYIAPCEAEILLNQ